MRILCLLLLSGCYRVLPEKGGGHVKAPASRPIDARDISLPRGYQIEAIAAGLTYPTGMTFDSTGRIYVVESGYSYGEDFTTPKLVRLDERGPVTIASGENNGPWNGVAFHDGAFYVAEGGERHGGRLLRIRDGKIEVVLANLPTGGDHHTDGPAVGPDGKIYVGLGTMTNSGVVGPDNQQFGWVARRPDGHDVPCKDITLTGENFDDEKGHSTGAFVRFGATTQKGQVIPGKIPCSGSIVRVNGSQVELVGWGFRNPFGMAFTPDGKLLVTDNGYDTRGSRPVWGAADSLWIVDPAAEAKWYGWPERADGRDVTEGRYKGNADRTPPRLLAEYPNEPPTPNAFFGVHSSSDGIDVSRSKQFGYVGEAFVAQFGDQSPAVGKVIRPVGFKIVRVNLQDGVIHEFAKHTGKDNGPASFLKKGGLERPLAVRFSPDGNALYVVDFGVMTMNGKPHPREGTGVIWKITHTGETPPDPVLAGSERKGELLFMRNCNQCHPNGGAGLGPGLDHPIPRAVMKLQIRKGVLGSMPAFHEGDLSDGDVESILDYVGWLRKNL